MTTRAEAIAEAKAHRESMRDVLGRLRARTSVPQLAEDALAALDPELTWLGHFKSRVQHNKLLSLAVLAGMSWLAGAPAADGMRPRSPPRARGTAPLSRTAKEKHNDSGKNPGHERAGNGGPSAGQVFQEGIDPAHQRKAGEEGYGAHDGIPETERRSTQGS